MGKYSTVGILVVFWAKWDWGMCVTKTTQESVIPLQTGFLPRWGAVVPGTIWSSIIKKVLKSVRVEYVGTSLCCTVLHSVSLCQQLRHLNPPMDCRCTALLPAGSHHGKPCTCGLVTEFDCFLPRCGFMSPLRWQVPHQASDKAHTESTCPL